ncbi:hypothetical protein MCOR02_002049 [Pyricularia oryzae]|uniref:AGC/RSK/P70 protein kinase n=3 Tax=Pyricularia oryzae TaxID=318829 RepID=G4MY34_PYRO7|nr:AGC/RSK/P70 protein kinase [Pyricularia oryzae 70-15]ELQ42462.1 serine/threonine-protein kinase psk1 [Pyricularia oryzae Y34]KAH9438422.1 hypothetical protein MCOR02_002049 [Pyricularia oryzae]EHA54365.1 AGC/RSK/P70 protein kinase [Pyricularia oryzae 70-15]KAI6312493.1 hypothetical protein MCOR34_005609 [Pyricularia oryzae]KAI6447620.1 hypothetical protein MCOR17_010492 [Pyricularia oryzae]
MIPAATPAHPVVRGFQTNTQSVSCDEDSEHGVRATKSNGTATTSTLPPRTPQRGRQPRTPVINDIVSANCSPVLKAVPSPGMSGIAMLRSKMEPLSLDITATPSRASSMSRSNSRITSPFPFPMGPPPVAAPMSRRTSILSNVTSRAQSRERPGSSRGSTSGDDTASVATTSYEIDFVDDFCSAETSEEVVKAFAEPKAGSPLYSDGVEGGLVKEQRGKITADEFEQVRCLGKGAYGTVILVKQRSTGRLFAQKQLKKASLTVSKKYVQQAKTERQVLETVNRHPFVVKLFYAFQDHEKLYLILEYGQGGELFHHLDTEKLFSEDVAAFYMGEMVLALFHLHQDLGVVYRDLKPENCLLDAEGHLLLTDFGLSKVAVDEDDHCNSFLGTIEYMAPEIILGKKYSKAVDWWALGALGHDLMTGNPPFRGANHAKIQDNIVKQKLMLPYFMSSDAKDLLTRLLRKDPAKRLGSQMPKDLNLIKKHRFFRKIDWVKLSKREMEPPIRPLITDPELAENFAPEFTELSLSPVVTTKEPGSWGGDRVAVPSTEALSPDSASRPGAIPFTTAKATTSPEDPFGGFSYMAPSSLLERSGFLTAAH